MRIVIFSLLSILCIPFFLLGFAAFMIPVLLSRGKVSGTAYEPFNARYQYELLGLRADPAARELAKHLPATNIIVRLCVFHLLSLLCRITKLIPPALDYPAKDNHDLKTMVAVRTEFIDRKLGEFLRHNSQVVILGAGWDTRAYNFSESQQVTVFEIDAHATQALKVKAVLNSDMNAGNVHFIECNFEQDDWLDLLQAHDAFDCSLPTFVVWEGVTMYLSETAIEQTFRNFKQLAEASQIVLDVLPAEWWLKTKAGKASAKSIVVTYGEEFKFYLPFDTDNNIALENFLRKHGLQLKDSTIQTLEKEQTPFYCVLQASAM